MLFKPQITKRVTHNNNYYIAFSQIKQISNYITQ